MIYATVVLKENPGNIRRMFGYEPNMHRQAMGNGSTVSWLGTSAHLLELKKKKKLTYFLFCMSSKHFES